MKLLNCQICQSEIIIDRLIFIWDSSNREILLIQFQDSKLFRFL
jgi:hypothetical protein